MHWVYYFGRGLIRLLLVIFGRWKVYGKENVPKEGPLLVICNHLHIADPPIVATFLPRKCVFMAKDELFQHGWSRFWVKNFGAFPVKRDTVDRESLRQAEYWLTQGFCVIMFPEGGRSRSRKLMEALPGAALLASRLGVPVLPVGLTGTDHLRHLKWSFFHHPLVTVTFGKPFQPSAGNGKLAKGGRKTLMDDMMKKIAALLPKEYRGVYGEKNDAGN